MAQVALPEVWLWECQGHTQQLAHHFIVGTGSSEGTIAAIFVTSAALGLSTHGGAGRY
jgi:hypothetical protein